MAVLLIAEDHDDIRALLQRIFERAGYTVLAAPDGAAALELAQTQPPDLVLTDLDMPGMDGVELCHRIRQIPDLRDIPVAILSGSVTPVDPRVASADLCGTVLKPFVSADLLAAVRHLIDKGRHNHIATGPPCLPPHDRGSPGSTRQ